MTKVFCTAGRSGAGKDALTKAILKNLPSNLKFIPMGTTRLPRHGDIDGYPNAFYSEDEYLKLLNDNMLIDIRTYDTKNGQQSYFMIKQDLEDNMNYLVSSETPVGLHSLVEYYGEDTIHVVYLQASDYNLITRAIIRESLNPLDSQNYAEVCRRFLSDKKDFELGAFLEFKHMHFIDADQDIPNMYYQWKKLYETCCEN